MNDTNLVTEPTITINNIKNNLSTSVDGLTEIGAFIAIVIHSLRNGNNELDPCEYSIVLSCVLQKLNMLQEVVDIQYMNLSQFEDTILKQAKE